MKGNIESIRSSIVGFNRKLLQPTYVISFTRGSRLWLPPQFNVAPPMETKHYKSENHAMDL